MITAMDHFLLIIQTNTACVIYNISKCYNSKAATILCSNTKNDLSTQHSRHNIHFDKSESIRFFTTEVLQSMQVCLKIIPSFTIQGRVSSTSQFVYSQVCKHIYPSLFLLLEEGSYKRGVHQSFSNKRKINNHEVGYFNHIN